MELNFLIGGPGGPEGLPQPDARRPGRSRLPHAARHGERHARRCWPGFTTVRNLGLMVKTGGYLLDVALQRAIDQGWHDGPRIVPAGHAITPYGGHLDPHGVPAASRPGIMPLERRRGDRQRRHRGARVRALPDPPRRQGDQDLRVGRRDVAQHRRPARSSTPTRSSRRSPTRRTAPASGWPRTPSATRRSRPASGPASTASSTASSPRDETIQMMVDHGTFLVSTTYLTEAHGDRARPRPSCRRRRPRSSRARRRCCPRRSPPA